MAHTYTFIPMLPSQLPMGPRICKSLPERPNGFRGMCALVPETVKPVGVSEKPIDHTHVCTLEWAAGPMNMALSGYYLESTDAHWLMWSHVYDDNFDKWHWELFSFSPVCQLVEKVAALYLLVDGLSAERKAFETPGFDWVADEGILDRNELELVKGVVWGAKS
jgi:hypothetical protein